VYEADVNGTFVYAKHIAFELFGYAEEEMQKGFSVMDMIVPRGPAPVSPGRQPDDRKEGPDRGERGGYRQKKRRQRFPSPSTPPR
jgi:PAS domain-containing protein